MRYLEARREAGCIVIEPSKTVYLLVPSPIVKKLMNGHDLDLRNKKAKNTLDIQCFLVKEGEDPKIIYTIKTAPQREENITELRG